MFFLSALLHVSDCFTLWHGDVVCYRGLQRQLGSYYWQHSSLASVLPHRHDPKPDQHHEASKDGGQAGHPLDADDVGHHTRDGGVDERGGAHEQRVELAQRIVGSGQTHHTNPEGEKGKVEKCQRIQKQVAEHVVDALVDGGRHSEPHCANHQSHEREGVHRDRLAGPLQKTKNFHKPFNNKQQTTNKQSDSYCNYLEHM